MPERTYPDLFELLPSWELHLRAERKSPATVKVYTDGVHRFLRYCEAQGVTPRLDKPTVNAFVADALENGAQPATARSRQLALRRFSDWATEEGELSSNELIGIRAPKLDTPVVQPLSEDQLKAMLSACAGRDLRDRRDQALIRLMVETGMRAGEAAALLVEDVDLSKGSVIVRRGKGGRGRVVPIGPQTSLALDRYLRVRRGHRLASGADLWLGDRGKSFNYDGLYRTLKSRAQSAGIEHFHPHLFRHTAAHRWLAAGGSEGGLMAVAGWTRPDMLLRYTRARAEQRAAAEAADLNLGDL